jgi:hypothetical protein
MFNLNLHFANPDNRNGRLFKRITCANGLSFSAQANEGAYCAPRQDQGPWTLVEIGFPSEKVDDIMGFAENHTDPTGTVYGYVPVEIVEAVVEANGGLMGGEAKNQKVAALKDEIETLQNKIKELEYELEML